MTNELIKEALHSAPLTWGKSPITTYACGCAETSHPPGLCNCMIPVFEDDEVIEQCDLGDTTCDACQ